MLRVQTASYWIDRYLFVLGNHSGIGVSRPLPLMIQLCEATFPDTANMFTLGPGMTIQHLHSNPADDFPQMREIQGIQDDHAAYLQCLMHITQILSNAHDLLYSSKSHSLAIAKAEHYYKHIDGFTDGKRSVHLLRDVN